MRVQRTGRQVFIVSLIVGTSASVPINARAAPEPPPGIEAQIEALQAALRGEVPEAPLEALVGVDPSDPEAARRRARELDERLTDTVPTSSTATTSAALERRLAELQRAFLAKPQSFRDALVDAEASRQQAELEQAAAAARTEAAERAARDAQIERARAFEEARRARTAARQALERQRLRVASWKLQLANAYAELSQAARERSEVRSQASRSIQRLVGRVLQARTASAAEALYPEIRRQWRGASDQLGRALARFEAPVRLPPAPELDLTASISSTVTEALRREIEVTSAEALGSRRDLRALERASRMGAIRAWWKLLRSASLARSEALERSGAGFRRARIGFSRTGLENLRLELEAAGRRLRAWLRAWIEELEEPGLQTQREELWRRGRPWLESLGILILALALWSRVGPLRRRIRASQARASSLGRLRRLARLDRFIEQLAGPILFVATCEVIARVIRAEEHGPELSVLLGLARWLGVYWLARRALGIVVLWLARRRRVSVPRRLRNEIERSVIDATRALALAGAAIQLSRGLFGTSAISTWLASLAVAGVVATAFWLMRRWRDAIAEAYLAAFPEGRLAREVEARRGRTRAIFVVFFALVAVLVRSAIQLAKEAILRIEQIRRALAFLFRLRLQRHAVEEEKEEERARELPEGIREAFTLQPAREDALRVDRFPGLDDVVKTPPRTVMLVGGAGMGKTTWLARLEVVMETEAIRVECGRSELEDPRAETIRGWLAGRGDPPEWRSAGERPRLAVVDDLHRLLLRAPGGLAPLDRLSVLTEDPRGPECWVISVHRPFWRWAAAARAGRFSFRRRIDLPPWSEEEIRWLLMARAAASGVVHDFGDLVSDATNEEAIARSGESFARLIWDASDGSPRVALYEWSRSLMPLHAERVRVRLYRGPDPTPLSALTEETWRLVAAIVQHDGLTRESAARVLREDEAAIGSRLGRLVDLGVVSPGDEGLHRLTVRWERTVERQVARRHLL